MALSYDEQIQIEMNKIKELKRKQKIKQAKIYSELGRMLTERFPAVKRCFEQGSAQSHTWE